MDDPFLDDSRSTQEAALPDEIDETMGSSSDISNSTIPAKSSRSPEMRSPDVRAAEQRATGARPAEIRSAENRSPDPRTSETRSSDRGNVRALRETLAAKHICPFCGSANPAPTPGASNTPCPRCTMEDSAATRQATKARIGPWHVLQTRNPAAPGMRYATLLALVAKGQVTARSIIRGPTTHQLWRWAGHVRGLSREFGMCYSCGQAVERTVANCPNCDRSQEPPANPDALLEIRDPRAMTAAANGSGAIAIADDVLTPDPYSARAALAAAGTHAERLRNNGDYRPVDSRIETRNDLLAGPRRRNDGRILSSMELAAALQVSTPVEPTSKAHPVRTTLLTLATVAVLALLIIGYARPDLRNQAVSWAEDRLQPIQSKVNGFELQHAPPASASPDASNSVADGTSGSVPDATVAGGSSAGTAAATSAGAVVPTAAPTLPNAAANNSASSAFSSANSSDSSTLHLGIPAAASSANQPTSPAATPTPEPAVTPAPMPNAVPENIASADPREHPALERERATLQASDSAGQSAARQNWALRLHAMDAEGRSDWTTAAKLYEQIETSPSDSWPPDTKTRLAIARRQLAGK